MDAQRFDSLARSLAAPRTRRGLLGAVAALGAGLAARGADAQVTQAQCGNKICAANPGVCANGCVCCVYGNGNSRCRPPGECSGTVVCAPENCDAGVETDCAGGACACVTDVDGGDACVERTCTFTACSTGADCPSGPCVSVPGCCGEPDPFCAVPCGAGAGAGGASAAGWG